MDTATDSSTASGATASGTSTPNSAFGPRSLRLNRPAEGRMIAGVAAGLARYLDVDVTLVRIALAVLTVVGGAGIPIYIAGWLLIPQEGGQESLAGEFLHGRL